jgi:curved DNA-binding protein
MDYYQTLGIDRNASQDDIKKAYRSLAMKHHPDRGGDAKKFQEIQEAYAVLSDSQKKADYDNPNPFGGGSFHFGGPSGFEQFFGQGSPFGDIFGFHHRQRPPQNRNIQLQTTIQLEDAFYGKELLANIKLPSGRDQTVNIKVPPGIHEGTTLRLSGMGDDSVPNIPRGDILLTVHIADHPIYKRQGDDLMIDYEITCVDAMIGKSIELMSIDGKRLETAIQSGVQNETILGLGGYGMPNFNDPSRRGRLLVKIRIRIPSVTEDQKEQLRKLNIK